MYSDTSHKAYEMSYEEKRKMERRQDIKDAFGLIGSLIFGLAVIAVLFLAAAKISEKPGSSSSYGITEAEALEEQDNYEQWLNKKANDAYAERAENCAYYGFCD